jgi:threonine aldolase
MIDLRSDTVTKPSQAMLAALNAADFLPLLGDDVFAEDRLTKNFEEEVASLLGKEAALFVPSGTMANQLGVKLNTRDGDEVILDANAHIFHYETAAAAVLSRVQLHTAEGTHGILSVDDLKDAVRHHADWYPRTSLVCLENTHNRAGGTVYSLDAVEQIAAFCKSRHLKLHLDGARLWNACAATGVSPKAYAAHVDTVAVCFSKGLGAPAGSAICGTKAHIAEARRYRKMWGGSMRQTGVLTAMARYALHQNRERLILDHHHAKQLAAAFAQNPKFRVDETLVQTNIVAVDVSASGQSEAHVVDAFKAQGVLISSIKNNFIRLVTHLDSSSGDINRVRDVIHSF